MKKKLIFILIAFSIISFLLSAQSNKVIIEAENYIKEDGNAGVLSKTKGRIESSGNECILAWNNKGHAVYWDVVIPKTSFYKVVIRYANSKKWKTLRDLQIDDKYPHEAFKKIPILKTGGLSRDENNWHNHVIADTAGKEILIKLTKGAHSVKMTNLGSEMNSDGASNLDLIAFLEKDVPADSVGKPCVLPKDDYKVKIIDGGVIYYEPVFDKINIKRNILYAKSLNEKGIEENLLLDIFEPLNSVERKKPVIIFIHGGGLRSGSKEEHDDLAEEFSKRGYLVLSINYRLRSKITKETRDLALKDAAEDAVSAIKWLTENKDNYKADMDKIFVGGESAGAAVSLSLTYDENIKNPYRNSIKGVIDLFGFYDGEIKKKIPLIIIHADKDSVLPYENAVNLSKKAESAGVGFELFTMTGGNHTYNNNFYSEVVNRISKFIYSGLRMEKK